MTETLFKILESISIIVAAVTAILGINSWRRETKWKRKYELAEEVLALFYEAQENILSIRSPLGKSGEGNSRKKNENESIEDALIRDQAYVAVERYESLKEPFIKLRTLKYRFIALFDKESGEIFEDLIKVVNEILLASYRIGEHQIMINKYSRMSKIQVDQLYNKMEELEKIIWHESDDIISMKVEAIIRRVEDRCQEVIKKV